MTHPDYAKWKKNIAWTLREAAYLLAGEEPASAEQLARDKGKPAEIYRDLKDAVAFEKIEFKPGYTNQIADARVQPSECVTFAAERGYPIPDALHDLNKPVADRSLSRRERRTLLVIVAALCKEAGIAFDERGAAQRVRELTESLGASLDDGTIKKYLDQIADALASRTK